MSACADVGKFHFTSSKARYFTIMQKSCKATLHIISRFAGSKTFHYMHLCLQMQCLSRKKDEEFLQFFVLFLLVGILIFILLYRRSPSLGLFLFGGLLALGISFPWRLYCVGYPLCRQLPRLGSCGGSGSGYLACKVAFYAEFHSSALALHLA